jgi:hypothetical protein
VLREQRMRTRTFAVRLKLWTRLIEKEIAANVKLLARRRPARARSVLVS